MRHPLPFGPCATLLALALATLLTGCGASPDDAAEGASPPIALVALAAAAPHTMRATITALGTVELAPDAAQEIAVPYEALVQRVLINRGTRIVRGQPLLELVASSGAHVAPEQAHRDASLAAAEQARLQRMHAQGLATDNELRNAANAAANAREQVAALAPEGSAARTQIVRAPRAGVVDTLSAQQGTIVAAGASLARVAQPDDLVARLGFEPADIAHLDTSVGEREIVITPLRAPAQHVAAHVAAVDRRVDADSRLVGAIVHLPRDSGLLAGESVRGELTMAIHLRALCVPRAAVLYDGSRPYVFIAVTDRSLTVARRRDIQIGLADETFIEVLHGLAERDAVVTTGNYELSNGMAIRTAAPVAKQQP